MIIIHSYKRNEIIKNDFINNKITKDKLKNLNFFKRILYKKYKFKKRINM